MNNEEARIWIATPSYLIRKSLVALLRQHGKNFRIQESGELTLPQESIIRFSPDILLIDVGFFPEYHSQNVHSHLTFLSPEAKICGLLTNRNRSFFEHFFDGVLTVYDQPEEIWKKIQGLLVCSEPDELRVSSDDLSEREKEVLVNVVKGLTNKEIGETLNLSVHTVISHRKNITRKLDIKSSSGLTIYAIMNNLISIQDVKEH